MPATTQVFRDTMALEREKEQARSCFQKSINLAVVISELKSVGMRKTSLCHEKNERGSSQREMDAT